MSILEVNPDSVIQIYGNHEKNLILGLKTLISILTFSNFFYSYIEFFIYFFKMITIQKKIKKNYKATYSLKNKILLISNQYYLDNNIDILTHKIAQLYINVISPLGSRILIKGLKNFLKNSHIQEKIRCLLFSGIRSVDLWQQFHGNKIQLIYYRNFILNKANKILYTLKNTS